MILDWAKRQPNFIQLSGFAMLTNPKDNNIRVVLQRDKVWEPDATQKALEEFKGGILVDCGAHWGYYSFLLRNQVKRVYAIESNPDAFTYLSLNIALNEANNIIPLPLAAWDSEQLLAVGKQGENTGGSSVGEGGSDVMGFRLDDLFERMDCLKVDCEGKDARVLIGAKRLLTENSVKILVESPPTEYLNGLGYVLQWESSNRGQGPTSFWKKT